MFKSETIQNMIASGEYSFLAKCHGGDIAVIFWGGDYFIYAEEETCGGFIWDYIEKHNTLAEAVSSVADCLKRNVDNDFYEEL